MKTQFNDAMKSTETLQMSQITPSSVILAALDAILEISQTDKLQAYWKLILSEYLFPMELRNEWLVLV